MRKLGLTLMAAFTATVAAAPASAVTVNFAQGQTATVNNGVVFQNFDDKTVTPAFSINTNIYSNNVPNNGVKPNGSTGNYAAVLAYGVYSVALPTFAPVLSFLTGSVDASNSVVLSLIDTTTNTTSTQAWNGTQFGSNILGQDGRLTFDTGSSTLLISGVTFQSGQNSFEFDNVASAAPEPATWAMMILGFGVAGMGLRSRRRGKLALA